MKLDVVDEEEMLPMPMQHLDNRRLALNTSNDYSSKWIIQGERECTVVVVVVIRHTL